MPVVFAWALEVDCASQGFLCHAACRASNGTVIVCEVPNGVGAGWVVVVNARQTFGTSRGLTLSFLPPAVTAITPAVLPTTGGTVHIIGTNFGSPNITFGSLSVTVASLPPDFADAQPCRVLAWNHTVITCVAPEGVLPLAAVTVTVAGQAMTVTLLSYQPPAFQYFNGTPMVDLPRCGSQGGCSMHFNGVNLGPRGLLRLILRDVDSGQSFVCNNTVAVGHALGSCTVPEGGGTALQLQLFNGGQNSSDTSPLGPSPLFSYLPPSLTGYTVVPFSSLSNSTGSYLGLHAPIAGGFMVLVHGSSLTTVPRVTIGSLPCVVNAATHSQVRCDCLSPVPRDSGR
jgi:hypothetical protein